MPASPRLLAGAALVLCAAAAYSNALHVPFVFDDLAAVVRNPTLHPLWPPWSVLLPPPGGFTVTGRPLLNLSLALNYAGGGLNPAGYHRVNLAIHLFATLALFGLIRRTLVNRPGNPGNDRALPIAFAAALLWSLHPLQTESVTYISQRAESQMALLYLLTLYCFRLACDRGCSRWLCLSALCCLGGMATKEVMVSAPLLVLLYDRTFVSGSFAGAWSRRRGYYLALSATWLLLAAEIIAGKSRGGTVGFDLGVSWPHYIFSQCSAVTHYLRLALWPAPLVFDYGIAPAFSPLILALLAAALIAALAAATLWALRRHPAMGYLGIWFFAILAPTSLVPGNRQTWAEHRMYLALIPLAVLFGILLMRRPRAWAWPLLAIIAAAFGTVTFARNRSYRSNLALWSDTAAKRPDNTFAHYNLGEELLREKQYSAAEAALRRAIALSGNYAEAHNNLGNVLVQTGRASAAQAEFETAARLKPTDAEIRNNLGNVFLAAGQLGPAESEYRAAIAAEPEFATAHNGLGETLLRRKDPTAALAEFQTAARLDPTDASVHTHLGGLLIALGRRDEATSEFAQAVRLAPADASAHFNYGNALAQQRRLRESLMQYEAALRLSPADPFIHYNYGTALLLIGRTAEARQQYTEALRLQPTFEKARERLRMLNGQ